MKSKRLVVAIMLAKMRLISTGEFVIRSVRIVSSASIFAFASMVLCATAAEVGTEKRFPLAARGYLQLTVPVGWGDKFEPSPPSISFSAGQGEPFIVSVNPIVPPSTGSPAITREALRQHVERVLAGILPFAAEEKIDVVEIKDAPGRGFYFFATDRAPRPGEYQFMTQGALQIGTLTLSFIILTNPGQEQIVRDAMAML